MTIDWADGRTQAGERVTKCRPRCGWRGRGDQQADRADRDERDVPGQRLNATWLYRRSGVPGSKGPMGGGRMVRSSLSPGTEAGP